MDTTRIAAWLLNEKESHDPSLSLLRRPRRIQHGSAHPDRDWTNPNRFSDPLNLDRGGRLANTLGLSLPGRPNKAYTWYLDNQRPCQRMQAMSRAHAQEREQWSRAPVWEGEGRSGQLRSRMRWRDGEHSLFARNTSPGSGEDTESMRQGCSHHSYTWERVGPQTEKQGVHFSRSRQTIGVGSVASLPAKLSPLALSQPGHMHSARSKDTLRSHVGSNANGMHAGLKGISPCSSNNSLQRISPSGSNYSLQKVNSNNNFQRISPSVSNNSPQRANSNNSLQRTSPSGSNTGLHRAGSNNSLQAHRLSPGLTQSLQSPASHAQSSMGPFSSPRSTSPYQSRKPGNFLIPSPAWSSSSPFSSQASSNGDVSFGSETDDEFFYVSYHHVAQGLADLSMTSSTVLRNGVQNDITMSNSPLASPANCEFAEEEFDFGGFSDDALSDDVFLDNPQGPDISLNENTQLDTNQNLEEHHLSKRKDSTTRLSTEGQKQESKVMEEGPEETGAHVAVESLRKNSLQSKMRQTWRHRRHKGSAANKASSGNSDVKQDNSLGQSSSNEQNICNHPPSPFQGDGATSENLAEKPCFYYVISPTDDVDMPDVIAVRKSSVELIRWQNSLRRRRRRQAKRHDLGRVVKKEPKLSATV